MHRLLTLPLAAGLVAAAVSIAAVAAGSTGSEDEEEHEFGALVAGRGAEETFIYCTSCHSEMIVAQQGLTRDGWIESLEWMVEEQGMEEIEEPDYGLVIDYLATNYGVDRPNFPKR